ncbi:hypothetical protein BGAL_0014g00110 [Botrytis galanthina]|uniref:Uncharacterized protein n=1 Tax=Botrytis galanthina TaxID=278940 RepID=A0A4S8RCE9_9HELO|nr:hypothetical protein BGAL_0014g00110 [Botrytis galanthina]
MPKTKAALKSAQNVQQKQKQKLKTEQKSKMMTTPAGRNGKPKASLDSTKSNASTGSGVPDSRNDAESTPAPKPIYPKPLVIWHKNPHKKRRPTTTSVERDAESTSNSDSKPTPTLKTKTVLTPVGENAKPSSGLHPQKPAPKPTYPKPVVIWHHKPHRKRSSKITSLKKDVESATNPISSPSPTPTPTLKTTAKSTPARRTTQPSPETSKPTPKPTYPKPVVIWHKNPHKKRSSKTTKSKKNIESTTNPISSPNQQTDVDTTPARRTTQPSPETLTPNPKPTYPKPLVIWHKNPHRKRRSTAKNLKKDVKSTTDQTPLLKQGLIANPVRGNVQSKASPEITKSKSTPKVTRNLKVNGERRPKIAELKKNIGIANANTAARIVIEISDSDSDSDDDDDDDDDDFDADANEVRDSDSDSDDEDDEAGDVDIDEDGNEDMDIDQDVDVDEDVEVDEDIDIDEDVDIDANSDEDIDVDASTTPQSLPMHSPTLDTTPDKVLTPDINSAPASPYVADLDPMPWMPETEPEPAPALDPGLENSEVDATSNIMELIPDFTAGLASPYLGDLDLMPWMPEVEDVPVWGLESLLAGDGNVYADANANATSQFIPMHTPTLDMTSNIMGSIPDFAAGLVSPYRGDPMLSVPEAELELASGLGNSLAGDGALLSEDMYLNMPMDMDMDMKLPLDVDANMDMGMDGYMNLDANTEINTSPSQTSWTGMFMDPPLTAEERDWDLSNVGIEEIDGLFEEMEKEKGGDVDVEMEMGE